MLTAMGWRIIPVTWEDIVRTDTAFEEALSTILWSLHAYSGVKRPTFPRVRHGEESRIEGDTSVREARAMDVDLVELAGHRGKLAPSVPVDP